MVEGRNGGGWIRAGLAEINKIIVDCCTALVRFAFSAYYLILQCFLECDQHILSSGESNGTIQSPGLFFETLLNIKYSYCKRYKIYIIICSNHK